MSRAGEKKRPSLWKVMALISALILGLTIGAIIFSFRTLLESYYEQSLREQLTQELTILKNKGFDAEAAAESIQGKEIRLLIVREQDDTVIFRNLIGEPLKPEPPSNIPKAPKVRAEQNLVLLHSMVLNGLAHEDGSFFTTDNEDNSDRYNLESHRLYLWGRSQGYLFCLYLPVESSNAAVNLGIRFTTELGIAGWLLSLVVLYYASSRLNKPHKEICKTASQIAELDFSQRCEGARTKELYELSESINRMSDRLQASVENMRRTNEQLKVELGERTRQQAITAEVIANLSHDLKTPVAIISGYAEGLSEGVAKTPEQQQTYYAMIMRESEHMASIIGKMLALTRVESGEIPLEIEVFDLAALLDDEIAVFRGEIDRGGLELATDYPSPVFVETDYESVRQSVTNYVQNAVFHINNGTKIRIWTEPAGALVRLCVANSSAPISDEVAAKLWNKLYRGDNARQRGRGEAGLGLCIVRGNMERLGLGCGFYNDPGFGGVVFWLELPAAQDALTAEGPKEPTEAAQELQPASAAPEA